MTAWAYDAQQAARLRQSLAFERAAPSMSLAQIADALGCSRQAVDQILRRAMGKAQKAARARGLEGPWLEALRELDQTGPTAALPTLITRR